MLLISKYILQHTICSPHAFALLVCCFGALVYSRDAHAQQNFAVDISIGQSIGLTPYQRDVVYTTTTSEPDPNISGEALLNPYLADETNDWGTHVSLRFHVNDLILLLNTQVHPRNQYKLHHSSPDRISKTRQRASGSYDDAGITYTEMDEPQTVPATERNRGNLVVSTIGGGWKYTAFSLDPVSFHIPVSAGLCITHISEPAQPYRFGIKVASGGQVTYRFAENFALHTNFELGALVTSQYKNREDAYRRTQLRGASTFQAMTSNMIQTSLDIGLTFIVR